MATALRDGPTFGCYYVSIQQPTSALQPDDSISHTTY